jgi:hypothetical protein
MAFSKARGANQHDLRRIFANWPQIVLARFDIHQMAQLKVGNLPPHSAPYAAA